MSNIREEHQNPYAYMLMCFFDIASSHEDFDEYKEKNNISGSESIFYLIGEWIDKFNMVYSMADYDMPRYELWQDFINSEIEENEYE